MPAELYQQFFDKSPDCVLRWYRRYIYLTFFVNKQYLIPNVSPNGITFICGKKERGLENCKDTCGGASMAQGGIGGNPPPPPILAE